MSVKLKKAEIVALREIRDRGPIQMYGGSSFWCSSTKQTTTTFKALLGYGFANVIDAKLLITPAGAEYIEGLP